MRAVVLAAGRGERLGPLGVDTPKCLLPIGGRPALARLLDQLSSHDVRDITVVTGYKHEDVGACALESTQGRATLVVNERYREDVNIFSLVLGLRDRDEPFVVFEADVVLHDACVTRVFGRGEDDASSWFTIGPFLPHQTSGILKADAQGNVIDVRVVPGYAPEFADYRKLIGILRVGRGEAVQYARLLREGARTNMRQYYLAPWIANLSSLPCVATEMGAAQAAAFNTQAEYAAARRIIEEQRPA